VAYRFNSGIGGVTCDKCNILFDEGLSYEDYKKFYGKGEGGKDYCWKCFPPSKKRRPGKPK